MTLVEKILEMRYELSQTNFKKSGKNDYVGFDYLELDDFMPKVTELERKYGIISNIRMSEEGCQLMLGNIDGGNIMTFTCPFVLAEVKGATSTQNLGATITYIRRYLYVMAYNIRGDRDILDKQMGKKNDDPQEPQQVRYASESQITLLIERLKVDPAELKKKYGIEELYELTSEQASYEIKKKMGRA